MTLHCHWSHSLRLMIDGKCEYIYRMQNTVDHTNVSELAEILGAKYTPEKGGEETGQVCAEACASGGKGA